MKRLQRTLSKGFGDVVAKCFGFCDQSRGKHKNSDDVDGTDEWCAEIIMVVLSYHRLYVLDPW